MIKVAFILILISLMVSFTAVAEDNNHVQHLETALDHITVLEFGELVTQAAAGSSAFNIEWRENKVLIKPMKAGSSTDLFVWTATRRFAYELDPAGEAKTMNYAIDNPLPVGKPAPTPSPDSEMTQIADMVLTRAFLEAERIDSSAVKDKRGNVIVRIENVFRCAKGLYVRYSVTNLTTESYRLAKPTVSQLSPLRPSISLVSLQNMQLSRDLVSKFRREKRAELPTASSEVTRENLGPGEMTRGVIVLREQFISPSVLELDFADAGARHVAAAFVF